jgi:biotin synthase
MESNYLLICNSTNQMLRANKLINEKNIPTDLIPVPAEYGNICNTGIRFSSGKLSLVKELLNEQKMLVHGIYPLKPRRYEGIIEALRDNAENKFLNILNKIQLGVEPTLSELVYLLDTEQVEQKLFSLADKLREEIIGDEVEIRGAIEFSNICKKDCFYCGLRRSNNKLSRYRMSVDEILQAAQELSVMGIKTVILQSGEDSWYDTSTMVEIIKKIRLLTGLKITLSLGERTKVEYEIFREAGASNYLLKIETTDEEIFAQAHPDDDLNTRVKHLQWLKELGYLVGSGNIIGLPGQTSQTIAKDLIFFRNMGIHMIGIGPLIPTANTPYSELQQGGINLSLRTIALTRLYLQNVFIPATTALATLHPSAQEWGLEVGANKLMIIATPAKYRSAYCIYDDKRFVDLDNALTAIRNTKRKIPETITEQMLCHKRG